MNEIDVGYKYERVHQACLGDEVFIKGSWYNYSSLLASMNSLVIGAVRRPIHPGADHEIVPEDEARKFEGTYRDGIEFFNDGIWKMAPSPNFASGCTFRRRKAKSEPAMDDGWELVPKGEVEAAITANEKHPDWQFFINDYANKQCMRSNNISTNCTYRRPKSKPVEQWDWIKLSDGNPECGKSVPVKLESGQECNAMIHFDIGWVYTASMLRLKSPVAYWFRMPPAPEMDKISACRAEFLKYDKSRSDMPNVSTWDAAWHACCDHYKVGDQSKGAK